MVVIYIKGKHNFKLVCYCML